MRYLQEVYNMYIIVFKNTIHLVANLGKCGIFQDVKKPN